MGFNNVIELEEMDQIMLPEGAITAIPFIGEHAELDIQSKFVRRGIGMAVMTMLYAALMEDDEAYKNATPEQRLANWFVRVPGLDEPVRIPIPFEYGLLFKAIPEAVVNVAFGTDEGAPLFF